MNNIKKHLWIADLGMWLFIGLALLSYRSGEFLLTLFSLFGSWVLHSHVAYLANAHSHLIHIKPIYATLSRSPKPVLKRPRGPDEE